MIEDFIHFWVEQENLDFYYNGFYLERDDESALPEGSSSSNFIMDPLKRYSLYTYKDELFRFTVDPVVSMSLGKYDGASRLWYRGGISFRGYIGENVGFDFMFYDNTEKGDSIDDSKTFSPERGNNIARRDGNKIEYSEVRANISYSWDWGTVSIGKDFLNWGYGESGLLVLSDKAPSFPFIRLDIQPVKWLSFNYIHAWLKSEVLDSSSTYPTYRDGYDRLQDSEKYLASHTFNIFPIDGVTVSLGESIVYSDRLELAYLMPIMFYRLADHFLSDGKNNKGANSQFFLGISSRNNIPNTHLYGTLFIDEVRLSDLFDSQKQKNQIGFTLGGSITNLPVNNLDCTLEYTKIYPYVYKHYVPAQTYMSDEYSLGHWMGDNADLVYAALKYRFIRGLSAKGWIQYIRKGGEGNVEEQYNVPQPPFLFGLRKNYTNFGFDVVYEVTHNFFAEMNFSSWQNEIEVSDGVFQNDDYSSFNFTVNYGLR